MKAETMPMEFFADNESAIVASERILYTPTMFAKTSLLHLQEIGELTARRPHTSFRKDLSSFLFFRVIFGTGVLSYEGRDYEIGKGDCVFIDCQQPYAHTTSVNLWTLQWVHFYGPMMKSIYSKYQERGGRPVFAPVDISDFSTVWENLYAEADSHDYMRDMRINEYLATLLRLLMAESWHPEDAAVGSKKAGMIQVKEYLDQHYNEKITLDDLAERFFINKYYLTRIFKEQIGMSILSYLQSVRITNAKRLLRFTDMTVEEIGYDVGIGAPNYFSRTFKEVEGVSPSIYRDQW